MTEPRQLTKEELIELGAMPETGELDLPTLARLRLTYVEARLMGATRLLQERARCPRCESCAKTRRTS